MENDPSDFPGGQSFDHHGKGRLQFARFVIGTDQRLGRLGDLCVDVAGRGRRNRLGGPLPTLARTTVEAPTLVTIW